MTARGEERRQDRAANDILVVPAHDRATARPRRRPAQPIQTHQHPVHEQRMLGKAWHASCSTLGHLATRCRLERQRGIEAAGRVPEAPKALDAPLPLLRFLMRRTSSLREVMLERVMKEGPARLLAHNACRHCTARARFSNCTPLRKLAARSPPRMDQDGDTHRVCPPPVRLSEAGRRGQTS